MLNKDHSGKTAHSTVRRSAIAVHVAGRRFSFLRIITQTHKNTKIINQRKNQ